MIKVENLSKNFKNKYILKSVSFEVEKGNLVSIIGSSGCGKTTLLKMINALIKPSGGKIFINDEDISKKDVVKLRRKMGYVIQQVGLFPHLTVAENIEIIPKIEGKDKIDIRDRTDFLMEMVGLNSREYLNRYPSELSGGQRQRVGFARAFAMDPDIVLMDEPFSALDPITRVSLQDELIKMQAKLKKTIVFVTHDMDEAIKISDKICIMNNGEIVQYDTPERILKEPSNDFVSSFVGKDRLWTSPEYIRAGDIMTEIIDKRNDNWFLSKIFKKSFFKKNKGNVVNISENISNILKIIEKQNISEINVLDDDGNTVGLINKNSLISFLSQRYLETPDVSEIKKEEIKEEL